MASSMKLNTMALRPQLDMVNGEVVKEMKKWFTNHDNPCWSRTVMEREARSVMTIGKMNDYDGE